MEIKRNYGIDLIRVISMMGIVGLHVIGTGGILKNTDTYSINYYMVNIIEVLLFCSVNMFSIITGYFYINKEKIKSKSIISLICTTMFYCLTITAIFYIFNFFNIKELGILQLIKYLFPPIDGRYWYITCYVLVFFMIPYINLFINKVTKKQLKKCLIILFIAFCIVSIFGLKDFFHINDGYSSVWLIFCYMIGAYIRKYLMEYRINKNKGFLIIAIGTLALSFTVPLIGVITSRFLGEQEYTYFFLKYNSPVIVMNAIILFLVFKEIVIKNDFLRKVILFLSNTSFGVYIIHCNILIFDYGLKNAFSKYVNENVVVLMGIITLAIITIYIACSLIDYLRIKIFRFIKIDNFIELISNKVDTIL